MEEVLNVARQAVRVRPLSREDVEPLLALVRSTGVFRPYEIDIARELLEAGAEKGEASGYLFQVAVALPEETVAGYACYGETPCTEGTFDLYWLATNPRLQARGVATGLLKAVTSDLAGKRARLLVAETEDSPPYAAARAFYETRGFERAASISDFYRPGVAKTIYVKALIEEGGR